jgi:hypothetical protein
MQIIISNRGYYADLLSVIGYTIVKDDYHNLPYYTIKVYNIDNSPRWFRYMNNEAIYELERSQ